MLDTSVARSIPHRSPWSVTDKTLGAIAALTVAATIAIAPLEWLLAGIGVSVATLLALVYPWLGWLGLAFALPISSGLRFGPASLTDLLFAFALALWCASTISHRRPVRFSNLPTWPVALYLFILYLSSMGASDLDEAFTEVVKWVEFGVLLWVVPTALPRRATPWLVVALLAAAALQGVYGLYQFIFRIGPEWFLIQGRFMRASGFFAQPNPYAAYLGLTLPVATSLSLWALGTLTKRRDLRHILLCALSVVATAAIGAGLIASWSRGGWLGAATGVAVVLAFYNRRSALVLAIGTFALLATIFVGALNPAWIPAAILNRIGSLPAYFGLVDVLALEVNDDNFAVIERVAHWVAAVRMWELAPWLGIGPGNYAVAYPSVALPRWNDPLGHAHNIYLNVLGETGLFGLTAFLLLWVSLVAWLFQQVQRHRENASWQRAMTVGVLGVIAHLAIHSIFDNLFVQGMYLHIAFWLALVAAMPNFPGTAQRRVGHSPSSESDG